MSEKPIAAFVLSLIGGILILLLGAVIATLGGFTAVKIPLVGRIVAIIGIIHLALGTLITVGSAAIYSGEPSKVSTWSIVLIVSSAIGLVIGAGLYIGSILALVGGILGLVWKPPEKAKPTVTPVEI